VRTLFGDTAAATLVQARHDAAPAGLPWIGPFVFGTDGKGADNLIVRAGGMRQRGAQPANEADACLFMNGPEIFTFTLRAVPQAVNDLLDRAEASIDAVDLFVFHHANRYILDHLRQKLNIPPEKFVIALRNCGNTVSSTIPIALTDVNATQQLHRGLRVMLVGFGVGYSWGATLIHWAT
jgi:3-oxoacyl-[acyl-carrier-protein] synthase III